MTWLLGLLVLVRPPVPGVTDPAVTQANIAQTICQPGYTKTVRPPVSYTNRLKRKLYASRHLKGGLRAYELDHLVPLEVGGAPRDPANLWMEPIADARKKDRVENVAHRLVCSGRLSLADAQKAFETWGSKKSPIPAR
jgi:hypothetical protein